MEGFLDGMASYLIRHVDTDGVHQTSIDQLELIKESVVTEPISRVNETSICLVLQGEKQMTLGRKQFRYGKNHYILSAVDLPVTGQVITASKEKPYLAVKLSFQPSEWLAVVEEIGDLPKAKGTARRAMNVSEAELELVQAFHRLVSLIDDTQHQKVLVPIVKKEIIYWLIKGPLGPMLTQMLTKNQHGQQMRQVIQYMIDHYSESYTIQDLAAKANTSVATFHRYFKEMTTLTPIQFQKQVRLQEARQSVLRNQDTITEIAFQVGYDSPSQFSREYTRYFGQSPSLDRKTMQQTTHLL
jgi:AraC-like DNA-binding protein